MIARGFGRPVQVKWAAELGELLQDGLRPARTVVWVPPGARVENQGLLVAFGAELVLTPSVAMAPVSPSWA